VSKKEHKKNEKAVEERAKEKSKPKITPKLALLKRPYKLVKLQINDTANPIIIPSEMK